MTTIYATVAEIEQRYKKLDEGDAERCGALIGDASTMIDAFASKNVTEDVKKLVCRNMVLRALGSGDINIPIGATQGTQTGLGYSQSFTFGSGQSGELYFSKMDKRLLRIGNRIGARSPIEFMEAGDA